MAGNSFVRLLFQRRHRLICGKEHTNQIQPVTPPSPLRDLRPKAVKLFITELLQLRKPLHDRRADDVLLQKPSCSRAEIA